MWEEIVHEIVAPGKVDAHFGDFTLRTDHPPAGDREGRAPEPFAIFLASLGTCAASFVAHELMEMNLPCEGVRIVQRQAFDESDHTIPAFRFEIEVPYVLPDAARAALLEAAEHCTVKRVMQACPGFEFSVSCGAGNSAQPGSSTSRR